MSIYTLGIDIGSTASKCVMLKDGKEIVAKSLIAVGAGTSGPQRAIAEVLENAGKTEADMAYTLATGYGRNSLEEIADHQMSELSCHAKGATFLFPDVHTVIDIGGQDVKVLQIDNNNEKATRYMEYVKEHTGKAEVEKRKLKNAFSHREMQDDDVILPPTYKENTGWQSIINIGIGLVLGAVMVVFLIMPARERALNYEHNQEMQSYTDKLNLANQETDKLKLQIEDYQKQKEDAEGQLNDLKGDSGSTVNQYAALAKILDAYRKGDTNTAVLTYVDMDQSKITDDSSVAILNEIKADMDANAPAVLMAAAAQSNSVGDYDSALRYYERYMKFNNKNPEVIYNMGMVYKAKGDTDNANQMFGQVIMNFADSEFAEKAKEERGY